LRKGERRSRTAGVETKYGNVWSGRALLARDGGPRGRPGRPVLQRQVLAAANGECRNRAGFRSLLLKIPETSMSAAAPMLLTRPQLLKGAATTARLLAASVTSDDRVGRVPLQLVNIRMLSAT
jgi:hypothetical protein